MALWVAKDESGHVSLFQGKPKYEREHSSWFSDDQRTKELWLTPKQARILGYDLTPGPTGIKRVKIVEDE